MSRDYDVAEDYDVEAREPCCEQDLEPWERRWRETYSFEPEEMEQ